jgi:carbon starvation protein CstA
MLILLIIVAIALAITIGVRALALFIVLGVIIGIPALLAMGVVINAMGGNTDNGILVFVAIIFFAIVLGQKFYKDKAIK